MPYLLRRLLEVRAALEALSTQTIKESPMLMDAYGGSLYKCPMTRCTRFFRGFTSRYQRDEHLRGHERNHKCPEKRCDYSELGYTSECELKKHIELCHGESSDYFPFSNVRPVSTSTALKDAIDRDDASAIRDICDPATVMMISETGFLLRAIKKKSLNAAMVVLELLGTTSEVHHQDEKRTALQEAVVGAKFQTLLEKILKTNVNFQTTYIRGDTPVCRALEKALTHGNFCAVRTLLSIDEIDLESCSRIFERFKDGVLLAAAVGHDDIVQRLFARFVARVPVDELWGCINAALNKAAFHNHESTVVLIFELCHTLGIEKYYQGLRKAQLHYGPKTMTKLLMGCSANINVELRKAAERGDEVEVLDLLKTGADISHGSRSSPTALAAASSTQQLLMMKLLLEYGAKADAHGGEWVTPLGEASSKGQMKAIQLLLDYGADPDHGVYSASLEGKTAVLEFLLKKGADVNACGDLGDALNGACSNGREATVRLLLHSGAGLYACGEIADIKFGETWSIEQEMYAWQEFFNEGPNHRGLYSALCVACEIGYHHLVQLLIKHLKKGAGRKSHGLGRYSYALYKACTIPVPCLTILRTLLKSGADPNYGNQRALQRVCSFPNANQDSVHLLLEHGADVNGRHGSGQTPLMTAAWYGSVNIVKLLLERGADINAQSSDIMRPTALAATFVSRQKLAMVRLLLENGADVNEFSSRALNFASGRGDDAMVQLLLKYGAKW